MLALALTAGLIFAAAPAAPAASGGTRKVDARVLRQVQAGGVATYWAILRQHADLAGATAISNWDARGWFVYNRLTSVANSSQAGLRSYLHRQGVAFKAFWILNAIRITSTGTTLAAVAARPEVDRIVSDWSASIPPDQKTAGTQAVEWNIMRINAPQVWSTYNDRGEGTVVANIDTGVQWNHPALIHQYRGAHATAQTTVNHNYNWFDPSHICGNPSLAPCDNVGHGTHTMGTMVGDDGAGNQIGVAPKAFWIAAKGCESNSCSGGALMASGQWVLAPTDLNNQNPRPGLRPQVVNNSWAIANPQDPFYRSTVQAWVASGVFPAFNAGSQGPGCASMGAPGSYPESYGVGAFDINNNIASFSSRGPSPFGGITKPNVSAPGVNVRSSVPTNSYAVFSGTSMATPHVAGVIALIESGAPSFRGDVTSVEAFINETAVDMSDLTCGGSAGNNNVWGEGRLDAFAAVTKAKGLTSRGAVGATVSRFR
jgi:subtilisin family serine protease